MLKRIGWQLIDLLIYSFYALIFSYLLDLAVDSINFSTCLIIFGLGCIVFAANKFKKGRGTEPMVSTNMGKGAGQSLLSVVTVNQIVQHSEQGLDNIGELVPDRRRFKDILLKRTALQMFCYGVIYVGIGYLPYISYFL